MADQNWDEALQQIVNLRQCVRMQTFIRRRATVSVALSAALTGCALQKPVVLDRQAMVGIKRLQLPSVGVPRSPDVQVTNGVDTALGRMGLIGAIAQVSSSIVRGNRSDALVRMMAAQGFDPGPALTSMLTTAIAAKGLTVVPEPAAVNRRFLAVSPQIPGGEVLLDCYVASYGFTAATDSDASPYRATVAVAARLIGPAGFLLMEDDVLVSGGGNRRPDVDPKTGPAPAGTFRSFSDAENDPAAAVKALHAAFESAAAGVVRRIT